jgi:hypothetical protein
MDKKREELLNKLETIKEKAQEDLKNNHVGYENCVVKNVIHYNKKVELINKETNKKEELDLCVAVIEDPDTKTTMNMYYLNGEEVDFTELMLEYESPESIKDVIDKTKENEEKPEKKQDKELKGDKLDELEREKMEDKEDGKTNKKKEKNDKDSRIGEKPKYIIQTVNVDKAYIDKWHTLRNKLNLPSEVNELAFAYPNTDEDKNLSDDLVVIMLDKDGKRIKETSDGTKVTDILTVDNATGDNPVYDDNTKLELEGYAEKNKNMTMKRFKAKGIKDNNFYLSVEQKEFGGYAELYAGGKTYDGNDPVELQLETDNVGIQTDLEMQEIMNGRKGVYNKDNIDKEADIHEEHGDNTDEIKKENADGNENTYEICELEIVPGTDKTWDEWAEELGDSKENLQNRYEREVNKKPREPEKIVADIEADYEMINNHEHNRFN